MEVSGDLYLDLLTKGTKKELGYVEGCEYSSWKEQIGAKFETLIGIDRIKENACPLNFRIEDIKKKEGYTQYRFLIESEKGATVPCYLLIPDTGKEKYPVAITLQGHSSGAHNSIGEPKTEGEREYALGRGQFAVQAVKRGFAALAIEQRGMGERRPHREDRNYSMCIFEAHTALLFGRTMVGERCWDVSRAIDALANFPQADTEKILITGNSGGGTTSYYAACYDKRIKLSAPSCSFCPYEYSILYRDHCACNYIPNAYRYFEMEDLSCMIAPRNFMPIAGKKDEIFLIEGVRKAMEKVKNIYAEVGAEENCRLIETEMGHWWCEDLVWDSICQETKKMGW